MAAATLLCLGGCVVGRGTYVTLGRQEGVVGYRVGYVDATPRPGTLVRQRAVQAFSVTVTYMLVAAEAGHLVLEFTDGKGRPLLDAKTVFIPIKRARTQQVTVTQEVVIPEGILDLVLRIGVVPENERHPGGWLQVRYRATSPND